MDNFIVSARKYRPSTFAQVVGQDSIISTLKNAILSGHLAQAFLFTGPRGVGKTTCARIMAKTINCLNPTPDGEPCNQCESCKAFNENASFNIHELDAASNNSVEDIRNLVDQVRIPPQAGKYKVYIIDEVHMLSTAAFNAFLKTLEEPPAYAKFILATTEKHKIIPTILSRCQIFDFKRINVSDIANHLKYVAQNENIDAEEEALHVIAQKADGALRDALSTFDQIVSFGGNKISYKNVIENLNILDYEYYFRVTDALIKGDVADAFIVFDEVLANGFDGQDFLSGLNEHLRNLLVIKNPKTIKLFQSGKTLKEQYRVQSEQTPYSFLFKALEITNKYDLGYKSSNNKRLHVEIALTELAVLINGLPEETFSSVQANKKNTASVSYDKATSSAPTKVNEKQPKEILNVQAEKQNQKSKIPDDDTAKINPEKVKYASAEPSSSIKKETVQEVTKKKETIQDKPGVTVSDQKTGKTNSVSGSLHKKVTAQSGNKRGYRNISIKDSLSALKAKKQQSENETEEPVIATPFSQEALEKVWFEFVEKYRENSPSFVHTLAKSKPLLTTDFIVEYKIPNILLAKDTLNVSILLNFLKKNLNNNQIKLKARLPEKNEVQEAYTDSEVMKELSEKYPELNKLKNTFDLELG